MGFNFRKSFSLGNGVRVTVGKKSASVSVGRKGVRGSVSTTGRATGTVSIPGTGLSYSTSKKISDLLPGSKKEKEKETKKTSSSSKTAAAKKTSSKTASSKTAAKTTTARAASSKTAAKTTSSRTGSRTSSVKPVKVSARKAAPAKTAAAPEKAPAETQTQTPPNPFATGKAKKVTED